jgi:hypothetical protein
MGLAVAHVLVDVYGELAATPRSTHTTQASTHMHALMSPPLLRSIP